MPRPMIGISVSIEKDESRLFVNRAYMLAIHSSGGTPVMLSHDMDASEAQSALSRLDGLLLSGGNDADPSLYGQTPRAAMGEVNPLRDRSELMLINIAAGSRIPVLGICRGMQIMNVALGGPLVQDIPSMYAAMYGKTPLKHAPDFSGESVFHTAELSARPLMELIGSGEITVNSFHHQGVKEIAPGLKACAYAPDGVCEGLYLPGHPFFVGVQWHPERTYAHDAPSRAIFDGFIRASNDARAEGHKR